MDWGELLTKIRADLQDTGDNPRWSDAILLTYAEDAIRDYSNWFPMRVDREVLTLDVDHYHLPSDFVEDILVECPLDTYLVKRQSRPGMKFLTSTLIYYIDGGNLYLGSPSDEDVLLTYYATHPTPVASSNNGTPVPVEDFVITIPDRDLELIRLYVRGQVYSQMRSKQAGLDRFKLSGQRDDNPLLPETNALMEEYEKKVAMRIGGGVINLYRTRTYERYPR